MKKNFAKKIFTGVLMMTAVLTFSFYPIHTARAQLVEANSIPNLITNIFNTLTTTSDTSTGIIQQIWNNVLDPLAFSLAQKSSEKMVRSVVGWVNSGFQGNPFQISDYRALFLEVGEVETKKILGSLKVADNPFGNDVTKKVVNLFNDEFVDQLEFNLDEACDGDCTAFIEGDFKQGGWEAWGKLIEDQNNPIGLYFKTVSSLEKKLDESKEAVQNEISSSGFQSSFDCLVEKKVNPLDGDPNAEKYCAVKSINTAGSVIQGKVNDSLDAVFKTNANTSKWGQLLSNTLLSLSSGLTQVGLTRIQSEVVDLVNDGFNTERRYINPDTLATETEAEPGIAGDFRLTGNLETIDLEKVFNGTPEQIDFATCSALPFDFFEFNDDGTPNPTQQADFDAQDTSNCEVIPAVPGALEQLDKEIEYVTDQITVLTTLPGLLFRLDACLPGPATRVWSKKLQDKFTAATNKIIQNDAKGKGNKDKEEFRENYINQLKSGVNDFHEQVNRYKLRPGTVTRNASGVTEIEPDPPECKNVDTAQPRPTCHQIPDARKFENLVQQGTNMAANLQQTKDELTKKITVLADLEQIKSEYESWAGNPPSVDEMQKTFRQFKILSSNLSSGDALESSRTDLESAITLQQEVVDSILECAEQRSFLYGNDTNSIFSTIFTGGNLTDVVTKAAGSNSILSDPNELEEALQSLTLSDSTTTSTTTTTNDDGTTTTVTTTASDDEIDVDIPPIASELLEILLTEFEEDDDEIADFCIQHFLFNTTDALFVRIPSPSHNMHKEYHGLSCTTFYYATESDFRGDSQTIR